MFTVTRSFAGAQDFACGLRRPQNGSSSIPTRSTKTFLNVYGYEVLRWRSGFRLRSQTPAKRLKFDPDQVHQTSNPAACFPSRLRPCPRLGSRPANCWGIVSSSTSKRAGAWLTFRKAADAATHTATSTREAGIFQPDMDKKQSEWRSTNAGQDKGSGDSI